MYKKTEWNNLKSYVKGPGSTNYSPKNERKKNPINVLVIEVGVLAQIIKFFFIIINAHRHLFYNTKKNGSSKFQYFILTQASASFIFSLNQTQFQ